MTSNVFLDYHVQKTVQILKKIDEDINAVRNTNESIQVPVGPVTRARAKRLKEVLNNLR